MIVSDAGPTPDLPLIALTDPRAAEIVRQEQVKSLVRFGKVVAGLAAFVWGMQIIMGRR